MKKVIYAATFLLGICCVFCSCNKEIGSNDKEKFVEKWWTLTREEYLFNGKVVYTNTPLLYKMYFEDTNYTFENSTGSRYTWAYSFIDGILNMGGSSYSFEKLTKDEMILKEILANKIGDVSKYSRIKYYVFNGIEIYTAKENDNIFWYIQDNKAIQCIPDGECGNAHWDKENGILMPDYIERWYDTILEHYKAE